MNTSINLPLISSLGITSIDDDDCLIYLDFADPPCFLSWDDTFLINTIIIIGCTALLTLIFIICVPCMCCCLAS